MGYDIEGRLLEVCTCKVLFPCCVGEDPDYTTCDTTIAWGIEAGAIDGVDLRAYPIGKQTELLFNPVLHIAASAVQFFVQRLCRRLFGAQRCHHKARVLLAIDMLGFGHHAALPILTSCLRFSGLIRKLSEHSRRLAGPVPLLGCFPHLPSDDAS